MNIEYKDVNVLESDELRQGIKDFTNWPTIPQSVSYTHLRAH